MNTPYTIEEHQHRLAAWVAATAARASVLCRFDVETGVAVLEASGFTADFSVNHLPTPDEIDGVHREWRGVVISNAEQKGLRFSDGIAAKLINCYLKVRFVCGGHHLDARVEALHPPVDRILLGGLAKTFCEEGKQWRQLRQKGWSTYDSETYEKVIALVRTCRPGQPLWKIEEHWKGHQ